MDLSKKYVKLLANDKNFKLLKTIKQEFLADFQEFYLGEGEIIDISEPDNDGFFTIKANPEVARIFYAYMTGFISGTIVQKELIKDLLEEII